MVYLTFRAAFNAVHVLWSPKLNDSENLETYGECANPAGHGHRYRIEITVASAVNAARPTVITRGAIERTIQDVLRPVLANADLNTTFGHDEFISTGENVTRAVWDLVEPALTDARLVAVRVIETSKNSFTYFGPGEVPNRVSRMFN
ncbi:MAG: 6-carboxytetrahydropterin synthase [bacterium]|nr:6-carboxytetrahydropterin synthase [bacterium]